MYVWIYKATEIAAKISQNTRNAWLIWRAYKVALWLEMRLSLPLTPSLCVSLSVCLSLGFSPPFAYCIVYDISPALFFRSQRHFCVTRRIAETFSSEVSLSFLFVSCCFSAIAVSVVLCCVGRICINKLIITSCCCCLPSTRCYHAVCDWHRERQATLDSGWKCQCIFICIASPLPSLPLPLTVSLSVSLFLSPLQLLPPFRATYSLFVKW